MIDEVVEVDSERGGQLFRSLASHNSYSAVSGRETQRTAPP